VGIRKAEGGQRGGGGLVPIVVSRGQVRHLEKYEDTEGREMVHMLIGVQNIWRPPKAGLDNLEVIGRSNAPLAISLLRLPPLACVVHNLQYFSLGK